MNATPHKHDLREQHYGGRTFELVYGDQRLTVGYKISPWRYKRLAARIIRQHDRASVRAGTREERKNRQTHANNTRADKRKAVIAGMASDWYMDSPQRMTDLHEEALREDRNRNWDKRYGSSTFSTPRTDGNSGVRVADAHVGIDEIKRLMEQKNDLERRRHEIERERAMYEILTYQGDTHVVGGSAS